MAPRRNGSERPMKILLTTLTDIGPIDVPDGVETVHFDEREDIPAEHRDAEAVVMWGAHRDLPDFFASLPHLRWIQTLAAGPDKVMAVPLPRDIVITNGAHFHDVTVAEHALALSLALVRRIPESLCAQGEHRWADEIGGIKPVRPYGAVTTLWGSSVTVWGFGAIGLQIASTFAGMGAHVRGIARTAGERAGFPVVGDEGIEGTLMGTDVLVMVLPERVDTRGVLNAHTLALLPRGAHVINVGRGSAIDEDALVASLRSGHLGGAGLDVFNVEPLPDDSALWDAPNVLITPHAAGGRPIGVEERVAHNVRALLGMGGDMIGVMVR